jgi:hypothetical protein
MPADCAVAGSDGAPWSGIDHFGRGVELWRMLLQPELDKQVLLKFAEQKWDRCAQAQWAWAQAIHGPSSLASVTFVCSYPKRQVIAEDMVEEAALRWGSAGAVVALGENPGADKGRVAVYLPPFCWTLLDRVHEELNRRAGKWGRWGASDTMFSSWQRFSSNETVAIAEAVSSLLPAGAGAAEVPDSLLVECSQA